MGFDTIEINLVIVHMWLFTFNDHHSENPPNQYKLFFLMSPGSLANNDLNVYFRPKKNLQGKHLK